MSCYLDKRNDSPNWYIYDYDERTRKTRSFTTGTADYKRAEEKLAAHILNRDTAALKSNVTLVYIVTRYWTLEGQFLASKDTVKRVMALVLQHETETMLFDWPKASQRAFLGKFADEEGEPVSDGTKRRYFGVLKTAARFLIEREELTAIPDLINLEVQDGDGAKPMPVEAAKRLFAHAKHLHEQLYLLLEMTTTPRPKHIIQLTWPQVNYEDGVVDYRLPGAAKVKRKRDKLKRRAVAALAPTVAAFLKAHHSVGHVLKWRGKSLKTFKMTFQTVARRADITGYSSYSLRKLGATYMRRNRVSELDIKTMLAHKVSGQTGRYAHEEPEYLEDVRATMQQLVEEICPPWLASYLPVKNAETEAEVQRLVANGLFGGRNRDRTCDPYHVKDDLVYSFQGLKPANDD